MAIDIIELSGGADARGQTFGTARRNQIAAYMLAWQSSLSAAGVSDPQGYLASFLRETDYLVAIRKHTPDLLDEIRSTAETAGQPPELLLAAQFMDEEWAYRRRFEKQADPLQKCSSAAIVSTTGTAWIGQNMDLGQYTDGHQVLLRIAPRAAEPGALVFTIGGMIGLFGVNSNGVGVCVNALPQLPASREGLPVAFVVRKLLQASTVNDATRAVFALPHATSQHYLIADGSTVHSLEASPAGVVEYRSSDPLRVVHTNHPLAQENQAANVGRDQTNTIARLSSLANRLMTGSPDVEAIKEALCASDDPAHPVCRTVKSNGGAQSVSGTTSFTTGSMVSTLQKGSRSVESWVSAGPPCLCGYTRVCLSGSP